MRIAAVALVLIIGAAVVLAFANTLNSWVLGGLFGGLAAILLSVPISLAIFTLLARRHEARQRSAALFYEEEPDFTDEMYDDAQVVYESEGYILPADEDFSANQRSRYYLEDRRWPVTGYLSLPPAGQDLDPYEAEDDAGLLARRDPRNYPRQPRHPVRSLAPGGETKSPLLTSDSRRRPSTRSLAQHQSAALHRARQEAQQRSENRNSTGSLSRRPQGNRPSTQRPRTSRNLSPQASARGTYRPEDEYDTGLSRRKSVSWNEDEHFSGELSTDELREYDQQYSRRPGVYPRRPRAADPWTSGLEEGDDEEELRARRPRRDPDRMSGSLRNPLVRRAPYLYDDDPLSEEFARQLDNDRPITRRSSLYERYRDRDEEEY